MIPGRWRRRLGYWLHQGERARQLREEMDAHLELIAREMMDDGVPAAEARLRARRQFGSPARQQEDAREVWIARWLRDLLQDAGYAARALRKQPGFAAVAMLSAGLGIGACSLIFALANAALFRPLPVDDPGRLLAISGQNLRRGRMGQSISYPDFEDLRQAGSFQGLAAYFPFLPGTISSNGDSERYWGSLVTANYFDIVRPRFVLGGGFDAARDDRPGAAPSVVLSYRVWRSRFAGDPSLAGRTIELNRMKVTVVGVTAAGFAGTETMFYSDFWLPFSMLGNLPGAHLDRGQLTNRDGQWLLAAGRLREGAGERTAAAEVEGIGARLREAYPATKKDRGFHAERAGLINPGIRRMVVVLFGLLLGISLLVLCTACANVASLLLARAAARQKEIATRLAIGAGRGRLVRQLLTESVLLSLLGGVAGYGLARFGAKAIGSARLPIAMPVDLSIALDYRVVLFCVALSVLTGMIFGLVPALRATRPDLVSALKDDGGRFGSARRLGLRNLLVVAQVAICMVLLVCSGLFVRSLEAARRIDTGMSHRNLLLLGFDPSLNRYSRAQTQRLVEAVVEGAAALPGVEAAALTSGVPLSMEGTQNTFTPDAGEGPQSGILADIYSVSPGFFDTLGIPLIAGEDFRPGPAGDDIAIVNQALVDKAFPTRNPVGRSIRYFDRTVRIVGVAATAKSRTIGEEPRPCLYFPMARDLRGNDSLSGMTLLVRTRGDPAGYVPYVRQALHQVDAGLPLFDVRTMDAQISQALFLPRVTATLFGIAGVMGLLVSTIGLYGVISFTVARQTRAIGIRMALGARRSQVVGMILGQGLLLTVLGGALGLGLAMVLSRMAASLLYGIRPTDGLTFLAAAVVVAVVAMLACLAPARRAASLDPLRALRSE